MVGDMIIDMGNDRCPEIFIVSKAKDTSAGVYDASNINSAKGRALCLLLLIQ